MRPKHSSAGITLVVHGGSGNIPESEHAAHREGVIGALNHAWPMLQAGKSALDVVEAAVCFLEDYPAFDAGRGSCINRAGFVELDASIMDGSELSYGAVAGMRSIRNPVRAARKVLESEYTFLVGEGAREFALDAGLESCPEEWFQVEREIQRWRECSKEEPTAPAGPRGTVGAVARDSNGRLAAATSTGGPPCKPPGRVGDSPLIGAGLYAEDNVAAISVTGRGELLTRLLWSYRATLLVQGGMPAPAAAEAAVSFLGRLKAYGGIIIVDGDGRPGAAFNTQYMAYGIRMDNGEPDRISP
ncbi:isoaspartyl peptidase/L-asparaginase family protein [Mesorhizobium sp. M0106]|uniref:isoaspartyl peptidase/L-asparaginase family protein n=1 Tax=Mesorhizobium sp. M0106 TaxID=2956880 RepID=UPI0033360855